MKDVLMHILCILDYTCKVQIRNTNWHTSCSVPLQICGIAWTWQWAVCVGQWAGPPAVYWTPDTVSLLLHSSCSSCRWWWWKPTLGGTYFCFIFCLVFIYLLGFNVENASVSSEVQLLRFWDRRKNIYILNLAYFTWDINKGSCLLGKKMVYHMQNNPTNMSKTPLFLLLVPFLHTVKNQNDKYYTILKCCLNIHLV